MRFTVEKPVQELAKRSKQDFMPAKLIEKIRYDHYSSANIGMSYTLGEAIVSIDTVLSGRRGWEGKWKG